MAPWASDVTPPAVAAVRRRFLAWAFLAEFVPFYAFYALWFREAGLDDTEITIALMLWSVTAVVVEVPSGALADRVSRRWLLVASSVLTSVAFAVMLLLPGLAGAIVGFVLWGLGASFASGTWQALAWDALVAIGREDRYAPMTARMVQVETFAVVASAGVAALLVGWLGVAGIGWLSVVLYLSAGAMALALPEAPRIVDEDEPTGFGPWLATLREGLQVARRTPAIARTLVVVSIATSLGVLDEYVPLVADDLGASATVVPVLLLATILGSLVGTEVAARWPRITPRTTGVLLGVGAVALAGGMATRHPVGTIGIAGVYVAIAVVYVVGDARLQERTPDRVRSTVTSVGGLGGETISVGWFAVVGAGALVTDTPTVLLAIAVPVAAAAVLTGRWLPRARTDGPEVPTPPPPRGTPTV